MYVKPDFAYEADADVYHCPAGEALTYRYTTEEDGLELRRYWTGECGSCVMKARCTTGKERRITRWAHEHLIEATRARLNVLAYNIKRMVALIGIRGLMAAVKG